MTLFYSEDGGKTWVEAKDNFPAGGITVTLPYPAGIHADNCEFVVTHMATAAAGGLQPGQVEIPAVTKTENGLQFTVKSLSPVAISWKGTDAVSGSDEGPEDTGYHNCPACGHHDWTATDAGYRCDHCGYLESVKQLAGYPNVKGFYDPKAEKQTSSGAATSPQTGDENDLTFWLGLLILSGLSLAGVLFSRRRKKQEN